MVIVIWFEFFYSHGPGPSADILTSNPGVQFQPDLEEQLNPNLHFLECSCRFLFALLQSDKDPPICLFLTHTHKSLSQGQHMDLNRLWWSLYVHLLTAGSRGDYSNPLILTDCQGSVL